MSQPLVYDSSALIALFDAHPLAFAYWKRADAGAITLVFPALAGRRTRRGRCCSGPHPSALRRWMRLRPSRSASVVIMTWPPATSSARPARYGGLC